MIRCRYDIRTCALLAVFSAYSTAEALDYVTFKRGGTETEVAGKITVEAADGGVLFAGTDGALIPIQPEELVSRRSDDRPFKPNTREELTEKLLRAYPGFKVHTTEHYLICYNTSRAYAQWVGLLYERLYEGYYEFWSKRGLELSSPEYPLTAIAFDTRETYVREAKAELGEAVNSIIGYYSLQSNQVRMYDLTGVEAGGGKTSNSSARINAILSQPSAERNVATIVHEATHQLAFNSGLQQRYADIPFWVSEGLAMYFETPDLESAKGWRKIGGVNRFNLLQFKRWTNERPPGSLRTLLTDDLRFRNPQTSPAAYGEAWALNYFLFRTRGEKYAEYLKTLQKLEPLVSSEKSARITAFQNAFGDDLEKLELEFLKYMRKVN